MSVYINGVLQSPPTQWVAWVGYGDTDWRFIVIDHRGMAVAA